MVDTMVSFFSRGSTFARSLGGLFSRNPRLDDDLLDEIETALLTADVGVAASTASHNSAA